MEIDWGKNNSFNNYSKLFKPNEMGVILFFITLMTMENK